MPNPVNYYIWADEVSNPVELISPETPINCCTPGAVATTGRRSTFALPVISGNIFEAQSGPIRGPLHGFFLPQCC